MVISLANKNENTKKENTEPTEGVSSILDLLSTETENMEINSDEIYDVLFSEDDELFNEADNINDEEIFHEKEYFIPKNAVLTDEDKNRLAEENMSLVQYVVKRFINTGIDYDELFSVALIGYVKAINSYNPTRVTKQGKPIKFSTFAYRCIENEIFYFIRNDKKVREKTVSLQTTLSTDKNGNTLDLDSTLSTESQGELSLEEEIAKKEVIGVLLEIINNELTDKERLIITHRFGISAENKTQNELAQMVNMSQANISKLEKNIMDKIKKIMISKYKIKSFDF